MVCVITSCMLVSLGPAWIQVGLVEECHILPSGYPSPWLGAVARILVSSILGKAYLLTLFSQKG